MFFKDHTIFHMICRATRWHAGCEAKDQSEEHLLECFELSWTGIHGAPKTFYVDGERGMVSDFFLSLH